MNRICMMCGDHNPDDGLLCAGCRVTAKEWPEKAIAKLTQNNAARQNIIEQMAKRINDLESTIAAQHDLLEERAEALERAQGRISELEAQLTATLDNGERSVFVEHDDRPADYIQPESLPLGSHYEYVEGCKP